MSWTQLLATRKVHKHQTSKQKFRAIVARDLQDAAIPALSEDRRFVTAYNAALQTAKMAIACAGYRVGAVPGHHALTFEAASLALGSQAKTLLDYPKKGSYKCRGAARGCCSGTLHCSASEQNGEILNVCNRFCFEPVDHSDAFRLPFLGSCKFPLTLPKEGSTL